MRLHQRTGIWLLLWPCWWSIALAYQGTQPPLFLLALFAIGAVAMRGAGCVINDIVDRKIDAQVERTKNRPLASGQLSVQVAYWLLAGLLAIGLVVLFYLNHMAVSLSLFYMILVMFYPFMKRLIGWPQLFLAITFNAGAMIGWAAAKGDIDTAAWLLYGAGMLWTLGYDTIYAHQDKKDDARIGVKSSAVSMGSYTKHFVTLFYLLMILLLAITGHRVLERNLMMYDIGLLIALLHLMAQVKLVNLDKPASCMRTFRSNGWFGWIIFLAIMLARLVP